MKNLSCIGARNEGRKGEVNRHWMQYRNYHTELRYMMLTRNQLNFTANTVTPNEVRLVTENFLEIF